MNQASQQKKAIGFGREPSMFVKKESSKGPDILTLLRLPCGMVWIRRLVFEVAWRPREILIWICYKKSLTASTWHIAELTPRASAALASMGTPKALRRVFDMHVPWVPSCESGLSKNVSETSVWHIRKHLHVGDTWKPLHYLVGISRQDTPTWSSRQQFIRVKCSEWTDAKKGQKDPRCKRWASCWIQGTLSFELWVCVLSLFTLGSEKDAKGWWCAATDVKRQKQIAEERSRETNKMWTWYVSSRSMRLSAMWCIHVSTLHQMFLRVLGFMFNYHINYSCKTRFPISSQASCW